VNADTFGSGGGIASAPTTTPPATSPSTSRYLTSRPLSGKAESLGGTRIFGAEKVQRTDVELGQLTDPQGHLIGLTQGGLLAAGGRPAVELALDMRERPEWLSRGSCVVGVGWKPAVMFGDVARDLTESFDRGRHWVCGPHDVNQ
jgi:hypothetical protein